jgi:hypothetical protein
MANNHQDNAPEYEAYASKHHIVALKMRKTPPPAVPGKEAWNYDDPGRLHERFLGAILEKHRGMNVYHATYMADIAMYVEICKSLPCVHGVSILIMV